MPDMSSAFFKAFNNQRYNPLSDEFIKNLGHLVDLSDKMNQKYMDNELFTEFFKNFMETEPVPKIIQSDSDIIVSLEVPDTLNKKDLKVSINGNILYIQGTYKNTWEENGNASFFAKNNEGIISKIVPLPSPVKRELIRARIKKGVLEITLPKDNQVEGEDIQVEISDQ